jgi:cytoskeletal protein CcmA (bactofilin family)
MGIWKDLTNPTSFARQHDTAFEFPAPTEPPANPSSSLIPMNKIASVIGPGVVIEGQIDGCGDMRICGRIKGDIRVQGNLVIDAGARIFGAIEAEDITLGGEVEGNVVAAGQVELLDTGRLIGDLKAKFLSAALGSRLRGKVEFGLAETESKPAEGNQPSGQNGAQAHSASTGE